MQSLHCVHSWPDLMISSIFGMTLNFFLFGATDITVSTATSPTLSGSRISTPGTFSSSKSVIISFDGLWVLFLSPRQFCGLEAITGALTFWASTNVSARMHCSSTTIRSASPLLM